MWSKLEIKMSFSSNFRDFPSYFIEIANSKTYNVLIKIVKKILIITVLLKLEQLLVPFLYLKLK